MSGAGQVSESELRSALRSYGLENASVSLCKKQGGFATVFLAQSEDAQYLVRVRNILATAEQIGFARVWALAISCEVPVPVAIAGDPIPRIGERLVEVLPYLPHDHADGGAVGPEAWIRVGEWLGRMHRLGLPLSNHAPSNLPYGNYPTARRINDYFQTAQRTVSGQYNEFFDRSQQLWLETKRKMTPMLDALPVGVVHGDIHFWNVLYTKGMPSAVIDLDFLQQGALIFDVAYACGWLAHWEQNFGPEWNGIMRRYIEAYQSGRKIPLTELERLALPWARIQTSIFFFIQVASFGWEKTAGQINDLQKAEDLYSKQQV